MTIFWRELLHIPYLDRRQPGRYLRRLTLTDAVVTVLRDVLRRRIPLVERFEIVHEAVIQVVDDLLHHALQLDEIYQQPYGIELLALHRHLDAIVVPMHVLALAAIIAERVSCREGLFHSDFKHQKTSPRRRCWL